MDLSLEFPMRLLTALFAATALAACSQAPTAKKTETAPAAATPAAPASDALPGAYRMDLSHTSVNFRVSHLGFSKWTARFTKMDGTLNFDPANPAAQSVTATIDATSLQTNYPDAKTLDFDAEVEKSFLDTAKYPTITFKSTKVTPTGPNTADLTGDLTLHGVTKPVTLKATFNGGYKPNAMDPGGRIGFSAHGVFKRSDFGITYGIPAPGTNMGVGDDVEVIIETEFQMVSPPPVQGAPATPPKG
jgi:polyisoprenoid-binding protein YceI